MSVIPHIGFAKTANNSIREWLRRNRTGLSAGGIYAVSSTSSHRLGIAGMADSDDADRTDVRGIRESCLLPEAIGEVRAAGQTAVISSEYLSQSCPKRLAKILGSENITVSGIICYLRRQDHGCASGYAQEVKLLRCSEIIGTAAYSDRLNWDQLFDAWQTAFPQARLQFFNYEKCRQAGNLLGSFKHAIGARELVTNDAVQYQNLSLSSEMTEVARMLNERGVTFDFRYFLQLQRQATFIPFGFSSKTTLEFEKLFIESNRKFANRFPEEFHDFARAGWRSKGQDMSDRVGRERLIEILAQYIHLAATDVAAMPPSPAVFNLAASECSNQPSSRGIAHGEVSEAAE